MIGLDKSQGIGASEVPAIAGLSPWTTPVAVWMRKVGLAQPQYPSPAMAAGLAVEGTLVTLLALDQDVPLKRNAVSFPHPDWPAIPLYATPDAFGPHRRSLAEVKLVGHRMGDWASGVPEYVRLQVQAQMAVYRKAQRAYVGALVGGELRAYVIDRDPEAIHGLEAAVADWVRDYLRPQVAPDPETDNDRWALVRARALQEDRPVRLATGEEEAVAARLAALLDHQRDLEAEVDALRLHLAESTQDGDLIGSTWRARWTDRKRTDWAAVARRARVPRYVVEAATSRSPVFTFRRTNTPQEASA